MLGEVRRQVELELSEGEREAPVQWESRLGAFQPQQGIRFEPSFHRKPLNNLVSVVPLDIRFRVRSQGERK